MGRSQPIRSLSKIKALKSYLKGNPDPKYYLLFVIGINSALRISDILKLSIKSILDERGEIRNFINLKEKKTGKSKRIKINESMRTAIQYYMKNIPFKDWDYDTYLFRSRRRNLPITRSQAFKLVRKWVSVVGLDQYEYSTHVFRKTWAFQARRAGVSMELIQEKLNHSKRSWNVTKLYIGIADLELEEVEDRINL